MNEQLGKAMFANSKSKEGNENSDRKSVELRDKNRAKKDASRLSVSGMMSEIAKFKQDDNEKSAFMDLSNIIEVSLDYD